MLLVFFRTHQETLVPGLHDGWPVPNVTDATIAALGRGATSEDFRDSVKAKPRSNSFDARQGVRAVGECSGTCRFLRTGRYLRICRPRFSGPGRPGTPPPDLQDAKVEGPGVSGCPCYGERRSGDCSGSLPLWADIEASTEPELAATRRITPFMRRQHTSEVDRGPVFRGRAVTLAEYGGRGAADRARACQGRGRVPAGPEELGRVRETDKGPLAGEVPGQEPTNRRVGGTRRRPRVASRGAGRPLAGSILREGATRPGRCRSAGHWGADGSRLCKRVRAGPR